MDVNLPTKLRVLAHLESVAYAPQMTRIAEVAKEAADEIERLRAEREEIVATLDRYEIAMPGGTADYSLTTRVRIACIAATDDQPDC